MKNGSKKLPVSLYCVWQWWDKHYQNAHGRPDTIDMDWLDKTYLGRQKFLFDHLGEFGLGSAAGELDRSFLSLILPYHTMIVAVILGMETKLQDAGGHFTVLGKKLDEC